MVSCIYVLEREIIVVIIRAAVHVESGAALDGHRILTLNSDGQAQAQEYLCSFIKANRFTNLLTHYNQQLINANEESPQRARIQKNILKSTTQLGQKFLNLLLPHPRVSKLRSTGMCTFVQTGETGIFCNYVATATVVLPYLANFFYSNNNNRVFSPHSNFCFNFLPDSDFVFCF